MILTGMPIIFIGIPLNTVGLKALVIGLIPAFIDMLKEAFIPGIGEMMKAMISKGWNDRFDAPPCGRYILLGCGHSTKKSVLTFQGSCNM
jgi:hypothetical protein